MTADRAVGGLDVGLVEVGAVGEAGQGLGGSYRRVDLQGGAELDFGDRDLRVEQRLQAGGEVLELDRLMGRVEADAQVVLHDLGRVGGGDAVAF